MKYKRLTFKIVFDRSVEFSIFPTFIFRSILGKELRKLCCLFRNRQCETCSINKTCAYSVFFESHIDKSNTVIEGRNRVSHPFILYSDVEMDSIQSDMNLYITLFGKGIAYLPYLYEALITAGKHGIFKNRIPFVIADVLQDTGSILKGHHEIDTSVPACEWNYLDSRFRVETDKIRIRFLTPLRMKVQGSYVDMFGYSDLLQACSRRITILEEMYGEQGLQIGDVKSDAAIVLSDIHWTDLSYYSSRQRRVIKMGGVVGEIEAKGNFSSEEISILQGGEIFHIGKNTGFGLGKIDISFI